MQIEISVAAGEKIAIKEEIVTVTTDDQLTMVAQEAGKVLKQMGLRSVKLHDIVLARKIEILEKIELHGSKTADDIEDLTDEAAVKEVCKEVASAIIVTNMLLERHGFEPFGLLVGGHTSSMRKVTESGNKISEHSAKGVSKILNEEISKLKADCDLDNAACVKFKGYVWCVTAPARF